MTGRYRFSVDSPSPKPPLISNLTVDTSGNLVWNQSMDNSAMEDTTLGYETAQEDDDNATQYLSVLDGSSLSLDQLNLTLTNPKLEAGGEEEPFQVAEEDEQNLVVYTVEGSDEVFGMQITQDPDNGSLQKYQFQLRKNEDGLLEPIPETIQVVPFEEEIAGAGEQEATDQGQLVIIQQGEEEAGSILPDNGNEEAEEQGTMVYEDGDHADVKPALSSLPGFIKGEILEPQVELEEFPQNFIETTDPDQKSKTSLQNEPETHEISPTQYEYDSGSVHNDDESPTEYIFGNDPDHGHSEPEPQSDENDHFNESDIEDYQSIDGVHITGQDMLDNDEITLETVDEPTTHSTMNILRHAIKQREILKAKKDNKMYVYVVQHAEKENLETMLDAPPQITFKQPPKNPRSILKSTHHHPVVLQANENEAMAANIYEEKRFARGKEAVEARSFNNFINKTTIPQAPIRKDRLPRKQKIKPVERLDEEIVVQEVMVGSNGFQEIDVFEAGNKENREIVEYVELSDDSDDDYDPKRYIGKKKKRGRKKKISIEISDESDDSVIELEESDDEIDEDEEDKEEEEEEEAAAALKPGKESTSDDSGTLSTPSKRRRGRPPKNRQIDEKSEHLESPMKKMRLDEAAAVEAKPEFPCTKCDKSFPSQSSLKTHLLHHNLQNSWDESKHKCADCSISFKNSILLSRHRCTAKKPTFNCITCKKTFGTATELSRHKRIHAKEQVVKSTTSLPTVSPKKTRLSMMQPKQKSTLASQKFKSPAKAQTALKCSVCGRLCPTMVSLNQHMRTMHKELKCARCAKVFVSRLLLDRHVRDNCVKSPKNVRRSMRIGSEGSASKVGIEVKCDDCDMKFTTLKAQFEHRVATHGLETPDPNVGKKAKKERMVQHGGIPCGKNLTNAFTNLKSNLFEKD